MIQDCKIVFKVHIILTEKTFPLENIARIKISLKIKRIWPIIQNELTKLQLNEAKIV